MNDVVKLAPLALLAACTTLGPMPATTGVSAVPTDRPSVEGQVAIMPAYFLSDAATDDPKGNITPQLAGLVEPDRLLGTKGLVLGVRSWGEHQDTAFEPMVGYRRRFDANGSLAVIGYGTRLAGSNTGASYQGTHLGGELAVDSRLIGGSWLALHVQASASLTYLAASGSYCVRSDGYGTDCDDDASDHRVDAHLTGLFPAATASFALDLARRPTGMFHGARLAFMATLGEMPTIRYAEAYGSTAYTSFGLSLTLGLGSE